MEERDRLATQLAEQKELLQRAQREAEDKEAALLAEFASERSSWTDKEVTLVSGFQAIEDLVDGELPLVSFSGLPTASRVGLKILNLIPSVFFFSRLLPWPRVRRQSSHRG